MLRILHIGAGPLGQRIINELHERGLGRVVGVVDSSPILAGREVSSIVAGADPSLRVMHDLTEFRAWEAVDAVVVTTSSDLRWCEPTFRGLLDRGMTVVSTCEELVWPWLRHKALADRLHEVALRTGGRLLGTGVNPGFLMDALPTFLTAVCRDVKAMKVSRVQDASSRRVPFQKKIGAGLSEEQFHAKVAEGTLRHVGLGESLHFIAHSCGLAIERWEEDIGPVTADRELHCTLGTIRRGMIAGVRQVARGYAGERLVLHLEFQAAIGQHDPHDRVQIDGEPGMDVVLHGGVHGDTATCAITLNAIEPLRRAAPGLHTMASIPMTRAAHAGR